MEQHLDNNASSTSIPHELRELWKSHKGTVIRIEALTLVAILLSFILAAFGSCRRWSNRWIIQKGFLAANALSLSLGTYSIGLMQSSPAKSEMYPVWAVSLLTLFGSVDSITSYSGLDYKSSLMKALFQLCLYCGYILLISIVTTVSSDQVGKIAICVLAAITFIKGFHRSLAFVLPSRLRNILRTIPKERFFRGYIDHTQKDLGEAGKLLVSLPEEEVEFSTGLPLMRHDECLGAVTIDHIWPFKGAELESDLTACKDVCLSLALSHLLQQHFFGLNRRVEQSYCRKSDDDPMSVPNFEWLVQHQGDRRIPGYEWAFKLIELELAFVYDVFFTSNAFLHCYQAKSSTIWTFASAMGICFVGAVAVRPGGARINSSSPTSSEGIVVVDTSTADVVITLVVLVSLALLQVLQVLRCWSSNWARVALALEFVYNRVRINLGLPIVDRKMKLRAFFTRRMGWLHGQLWQNKLGQYSVLESTSIRGLPPNLAMAWDIIRTYLYMYLVYGNLAKTLGMEYILKAFWELLGSTTVGAAVVLDSDVKASVSQVLGTIQIGPLGPVSPLLSAEGMKLLEQVLPPRDDDDPDDGPGMRFLVSIWTFHVATCYCELSQRRSGGGILDGDIGRDFRVATTLSKYCAYLTVCAPELLPGDDREAKYVSVSVAMDARSALRGATDRLEAMEVEKEATGKLKCFWPGVNLGKRLQHTQTMSESERWRLLADFWTRALLAAAPSENVEDHVRHLSQGGEFITHVWSFLFHAGIVNWQQQLYPEVSDDSRHQ